MIISVTQAFLQVEGYDIGFLNEVIASKCEMCFYQCASDNHTTIQWEKSYEVRKIQMKIITNPVSTDEWLLSLSRLVEEVKIKCAGVQLQNEDVYMATTFQDFIQMFVRRLRGEDQEEELVIDYVSLRFFCLGEHQLSLLRFL